MTAKYDIFEASFTGPSSGNPYVEVSFDAVFSQHSREVRVPGFYDGDGTYRVRFMPDTEGEWTFRTRSKTAALDGRTGSFTATSILDHVSKGLMIADLIAVVASFDLVAPEIDR